MYIVTLHGLLFTCSMIKRLNRKYNKPSIVQVISAPGAMYMYFESLMKMIIFSSKIELLLIIIDTIIIVFVSDKSVVYSQAPSTADLMLYVAQKIPTMWYRVGILLDVEATTLDTLEKEVADHDQVRLFIKVFQQWKREQKPKVPFTWDTIINTLEKLKENETVTDLKKFLNGK